MSLPTRGMQPLLAEATTEEMLLFLPMQSMFELLLLVVARLAVRINQLQMGRRWLSRICWRSSGVSDPR